MAGEWKTAPLGELTENLDSIRVPVKERDRRFGPYPYYGASGIVDYVDGYLFDGEYLLIAEDGENLRTRNTPVAFLARRKFWVNNHAHIVRGNAQADTRFLMYALTGTDINGYLTGSTMPKLTQGNMNRIPIFAPPLNEQRAIAQILGTLDDKIELNRRMNETLEAMARAIFKSWFVDFDPVRAKAEGRDPGLPKAIADLFPDSFEDSELGEIPKGWRVGSVADVAIVNACTLGQHDSLETIDYIEISEVMRGEVNAIIRYERGQEPSRARRRLQHGDTVLSTVRPDRGAYFLTLEPPETLIASTGFAVLTPKTGHWAFLHTLTTQQEIGDELGRLADGGAYPAVRPEVVGNLPIIVPDDTNLINRYESLTQPLFRRAAMNRRESRVLTAVRDTLLPKLLSGEIRVADAKRIIGRNI
jgi:type I restriction enzyme S subunit